MSQRHTTSFGFVPSPTLSASVVERSFADGEDIFREGESADGVIGIVSGRVKLWRVLTDGTACTLLVLGAGELIGTMAVAQDTPHLTSATALSAVEIQCWDARLFRAELRTSPTLPAELLALAARRATQLIGRFEDVVALPVETRLARAIIRLVGTFGGHDDALAVTLEVRQQDLAEMAISTVPTVSRILGGWKAAGIVVGGRGTLTVPHLARLALVARLHLD